MDILNMFLLVSSSAESGAKKGSSWSGLLLILVLLVLFWLFFIRPQNKKNKEQQKFRENLKKGDKIVTIGGIHGKIDEVKGTTVIVSIDANVKMEFEKSAIIPDSSQVGQT